MLLMNVCFFLCNSEMLLIPLQLITVIIIATVVTITTTVLMQLIAKSITSVHFQVRVCNTRPLPHDVSVLWSIFITNWKMFVDLCIDIYY